MLASVEFVDSDFIRPYLGGKPFLVDGTLVNNGNSITTNDALVDTGANGYVFVSVPFAKQLLDELGFDKFVFPKVPVGSYDGKTRESISIALRGTLQIQGRTLENEIFLVIRSAHDMIIGDKWFARHDVLPDCRNRCLVFGDEEQNTDPEPRPATRQDSPEVARLRALIQAKVAQLEAISRAAPRPTPKPGSFTTTTPFAVPKLRQHVDATDTSPEAKMQRSLLDQPPCVKDGDREPPRPRERNEESRQETLRDAQGPYTLRRDAIGWHKHRPPNIAVMGAMAFRHITRDQETFVTSLNEIDHYILEEKRRIQGLSEDEPELRDKAMTEVPECYHGYLDVFSKAISDDLAESRPYDHSIDLVDGGRPEELGYSPLRKMTLEEMEACKKYVTENLDKGFIQASSSPWAAPILFSRKADGGLRFCVDYRKLNAITKKDRYPLPLIDETLARVTKAKIFTKIDIRQAFHKIRMNPDHETLTTFRTRYGAYKYKVMPFGLTNGPATFQRFINDTMMGYIDDFVSAYIDDILIYSESEEEHRLHVEKVLERLREAGLQADLKKCEFHVTKTKYLGFIVGTDGLAVDPMKVAAVRDWNVPKNLKGVQAFLGFCNFYRRFIREYGRVARPLTNLTKKGEAFTWTRACQEAFDELKSRLLQSPVLAHFDHDLPTKVETDSSDGVIAGVLSQQGAEDGDWHPVAYFSETMQGAEHNYAIHDKELLAVVRALLFWRAELVGLQMPFVVITDHQALEYFSTKRLLNLRQAGWAELLAQYHFTITYRPGKENAAADALSRKSEDLKTQQERKDAERTMRIFRPLEREDQATTLSAAVIGIANIEVGVDLIDAILRNNQTSESLAEYRRRAREDPDSGFSLMDERILLRDGRLVVPEEDTLRTRIVEEIHARKTSAHPGRNKTKKMVTARYWWPGMAGYVDRYVANCMTCIASKVPRDKTPGFLQPLPVPLRPWKDLVMDFKKLPKDKTGHNNALVIIDRLSKTSWTIPCLDTATARDAARMYYEGPFRQNGLPQSIVSDRGPQFISSFTDELSKILGIQWSLASAGHSQTAGQAEIMNEYLDQRLRPFVNHFQNDWAQAIPAMDAVQGSVPHDSTGLSPHEITRGFPMPLQFDWESRTDLTKLPAKERYTRAEAQQTAETVRNYIDVARSIMKNAQDASKAKADQHRRAPDFDVGDSVFILKKAGTQTDRPSDKLDYPLTRRCYKIVEKRGDATFRLEMPSLWKGSNLFHADRLRKYPNNPVPGQVAEQPDAEEVDGEDQWEVEKVRASRISRGKLQYQVDWKGFDPDDRWYNAADFKEAPFAIRDYHEECPDKPGPPERLPEWVKAAEEDRFEPPHVDDDSAVSGESVSGPRRSNRRVRGK